MDLKAYYQTVRRIAASIAGDSVVVVSKATPDGGRAGRFTEVPCELAARMVADGIAEIAPEEDAARFAEQTKERQAEEERRRAAARIQVNVISEGQARALSAGPAPRSRRERS